MTPQEARNEYRRQYRKNMTPEQRQRESEYNRKWRQDHPDLVKAAHVRYWTKKAAEIGLVQEPATERTAADAPQD